VNFVVVDLDQKLPPAQKAIVEKYYQGLIPHVAVLDRFGHTLYSDAGEVEEATIVKYLDKALAK
jgi:hypothetical protein